MEKIGGLLFVLGAGSLLLPFIGYEFSFLGWIDNWGTTIGYLIKGGAIAVGGAMWLIGRKQDSGEV